MGQIIPVARFTEWSLDSTKVRMQYGPSNIGSVGKTNFWQALAFDFFVEKWDIIRERFGSLIFGFGEMIQGVTSLINNKSQMKQLEQLFSQNPPGGSGDKSARLAIEQIGINVAWKERYEEEVAQFLQENSTT